MREAVNPHSGDDVVDLLRAGKLTPAQAFEMFRKLHYSEASSSASPSPSAVSDAERRRRLEKVMKELDDLIGLDEVKHLVREIQAFVEIQKRRAALSLATEPQMLHMIFKGNPGTGKTTVARIIGTMFREMEVLPRGHLVEVERADLVGEYIGHTAAKTREQLKQAMGGILFIDEAYSLARGGEKDFGKEAIDTLVKGMEDSKGQFVVILAGYLREMDYFLQTNPGLRSRFPIQVIFPDYSVGELLQIAELMLSKRQYRLSDRARRKLDLLVRRSMEKGEETPGNARYIRNLIEKAIRRQAVRLVRKKQVSREDLMVIEAEDLGEV